MTALGASARAPGLLDRASVALDVVARPLDSVRRAVFRATLRSQSVAWVVRSRDRRLAALLALQAVAAFVLTLFFPTVLLVLGPVLFGVLHVAADVRYLVLRRGLASWWKNAVFGFCLSLVAIRGLFEARVLTFDPMRLEFALTGLFMAVGAACGTFESRATRRGLLTGVAVLGLTALALLYPWQARLVFTHLHNFIALALWAALFRKRLSVVVLPLALIGLGMGVFASGVVSRFVLHTQHLQAFGVHLLEAVDWYTPTLPVTLGIGLLCAYLFGQSIHYATWLSLIPQDDARAEGIMSFRLSARGLLADFGVLGLLAIIVTGLLVLCAALDNARATRDVYLSLASFHSYMELVLFSYFVSRGLRTLAAER